ncbi:hypothetical protein [Paenibacillus spongiae]|uniref:Uncharacterized protein n=1 Tax=Paenibacillus spongiae TaxID=2909671 RepID=A0ABY5S454_9BACL|nr:hypothetical protein [Paenibacillus spongiae]UVI27642.1 hypothetical protein L1F29_19440 [Paenibacillus spongiae]
MRARQWIGAVAHLLLGFLFPYVFIGSIVLINGFMSPSTPKQKLMGTVIAVVYTILLIAVNWLTLKGLPRRVRLTSILVHIVLFAGSSLLMLWSLRW